MNLDSRVDIATFNPPRGGFAHPTGVERRSNRPGAEAPIKAILPLGFSAGTCPAQTSASEM
jgi:hypothetical protein